jgi:aspartate/methionine/tyrosine aminotransferase
MREAVGGAIRDRVRGNLAAAKAIVSGDSPCTLLGVEGGWYATIRLPQTRGEEAWVVGLLGECGVLVHPGHFFDFPEEVYVVVSLLTAPEVLREGLTRLLEYASA